MKPSDYIVSTYLRPEGVSLVDGEIDGRPVAIEGTVRGAGGSRAARGNVCWYTHPPGKLGKHSVAGANQRDACVMLVTFEDGSKWKQDMDGPQMSATAAFDYDFIKRLIDSDEEAEEELVRIASQGAAHCEFRRLA